VTHYESVGGAELQLLYVPPGGKLGPIPPGRFRATMDDRKAQTDGLGQFVIENVPANVPAIRLRGGSGDLSNPAPPVAGGVTELRDVVIE
jgi:hypothetical protein